MKDTANKKPSKECKAPPMVARLLTGFFFSVVGNQEEERKSVYFSRQKNVKGGVLIFVVADIWNCYNMDMKKAINYIYGGIFGGIWNYSCDDNLWEFLLFY